MMTEKITSYKQVKPVIEEVLKNMDEAKLEERFVTRFVLSEQAMERLVKFMQYKVQGGIEDDVIENVHGLAIKTKSNLYSIAVKENEFPLFFISYMHELGHIANYDFYKKSMPTLEKYLIAEGLAETFAFWACYEFNSLNNFYNRGKDLFFKQSDEYFAEQKISSDRKSVLLYRFLSDFHKLFNNPRATYKHLQALSLESSKTLLEYVSKHYVSSR